MSDTWNATQQVTGLTCACKNQLFQALQTEHGLKLYCPSCKDYIEGYEVRKVGEKEEAA